MAGSVKEVIGLEMDAGAIKDARFNAKANGEPNFRGKFSENSSKLLIKILKILAGKSDDVIVQV